MTLECRLGKTSAHAHTYVERGKRKTLGESLTLNNMVIKELNEGDRYTYLGIDESVGMDEELSKEKVQTEYLQRVKKIWQSELNSRNKTITHNCFAVAIFRPTVGIIDWTRDDIRNLDKRTRKIMTMAGSLHIRSDADRLYVSRKDRGRGILSIEDVFCSRMIGLCEHIENVRNTNIFLNKAYTHE